MISIITPVLNFDSNLKNLYQSIIKQHNLNQFEWIIIKESKYLFKKKKFKLKEKLNLIILYINKKNIYSAINAGIQNSNYQYYITIGQDDIFTNNIFQIFLNNINTSINMYIYKTTLKYSAPIALNKKKFFENILYETNHSGGIILEKKIHDNIGYYNENYKIASDQLILKKSLNTFNYLKFIDQSAIIGGEGVTNKNKKLSIIENFKIDVSLKNVNLIDIFFFIFRYIKFSLFK